jgi:hypothetical protein
MTRTAALFEPESGVDRKAVAERPDCRAGRQLRGFRTDAYLIEPAVYQTSHFTGIKVCIRGRRGASSIIPLRQAWSLRA